MTTPQPPGPPPVPAPIFGPVMIAPESVPDERSVMSVMSQLSRGGEWTLPRMLHVSAVMGHATIDLTQVRIGPGTSEIVVRACMGEVKIIVPHNLRVDCDGHPLMGEFSLKRVPPTVPSPEAPLLRITGWAFMASVTVKIVDPTLPRWRDRMRGLLGSGDEVDE
jgi:hypothetical protein